MAPFQKVTLFLKMRMSQIEALSFFVLKMKVTQMEDLSLLS